MYDTVKRIYLNGMIDEETGLFNAIKFGWITEEEKKEIIESKKATQDI